MYVHRMSAFIPRTQKREFDAVEMELQIGVSYRVHDGTWSWGLYMLLIANYLTRPLKLILYLWYSYNKPRA